MSYSFTVPRYVEGAPSDAHVTPETLEEEAEAAMEANFAGVSDGEQKEANLRQARTAIQVALALADEGVVGETFRANFAGHGNPTPGSPPEGWSNDTCTITLTAVKVATPSEEA